MVGYLINILSWRSVITCDVYWTILLSNVLKEC